MNDQRSLTDQLNDLERLAVKAGMYDAHDWILMHRAKTVKVVCMCGATDPATEDIGDGLQRCVHCGCH